MNHCVNHLLHCNSNSWTYTGVNEPIEYNTTHYSIISPLNRNSWVNHRCDWTLYSTIPKLLHFSSTNVYLASYVLSYAVGYLLCYLKRQENSLNWHLTYLHRQQNQMCWRLLSVLLYILISREDCVLQIIYLFWIRIPRRDYFLQHPITTGAKCQLFWCNIF